MFVTMSFLNKHYIIIIIIINTFFFTAIKEWNSLSIDLKNINCENSFKVKLKQELIEVAKRKDDDVFERIV